MIKDIRSISKPGIVLARGPEYDSKRAYGIGLMFLKIFLTIFKRLGSSYPSTVQDEDGVEHDFDEFFLLVQKQLDRQILNVRGRNRIRLKHGPYCINLDLDGSESLYLTERGYTTVTGDPAEDFDAAPTISISSSVHPTGFLSEMEEHIAMGGVDAFLRQGLLERSPDNGRIIFLRFTEKKFLKNHDSLLFIDCVDTRDT